MLAAFISDAASIASTRAASPGVMSARLASIASTRAASPGVMSARLASIASTRAASPGVMSARLVSIASTRAASPGVMSARLVSIASTRAASPGVMSARLVSIASTRAASPGVMSSRLASMGGKSCLYIFAKVLKILSECGQGRRQPLKCDRSCRTQLRHTHDNDCYDQHGYDKFALHEVSSFVADASSVGTAKVVFCRTVQLYHIRFNGKGEYFRRVQSRFRGKMIKWGFHASGRLAGGAPALPVRLLLGAGGNCEPFQSMLIEPSDSAGNNYCYTFVIQQVCVVRRINALRRRYRLASKGKAAYNKHANACSI